MCRNFRDVITNATRSLSDIVRSTDIRTAEPFTIEIVYVEPDQHTIECAERVLEHMLYSGWMIAWNRGTEESSFALTSTGYQRALSELAGQRHPEPTHQFTIRSEQP